MVSAGGRRAASRRITTKRTREFIAVANPVCARASKDSSRRSGEVALCRAARWSRVEAVRAGCRILALLLLLAGPLAGRAQQAAALLDELHRIGLDAPQTFKVTDLYLQRDALRLLLRHGTLVFLAPVAGRVTGALFEGAGEVLVVPPQPAERQQLVKFTGSPLLTESFARLSLRFTRPTFEELRAQMASGHGEPAHDPELLERWEPLLAPLNRAHSLRLLLDYLDDPVPYFYAGVEGRRLGTFNVVVDDRRPEQLLVGQVRRRDDRAFYDVWSSFSRRQGPATAPPVRALAYRLRSTLLPTTELEADREMGPLIFLPAHPPPPPPPARRGGGRGGGGGGAAPRRAPGAPPEVPGPTSQSETSATLRKR